jgi:hypothetical protein
MSIKIYNGYIFNGDIKEFRKKCIKLLPMVKEYKKKIIDVHIGYVKEIKEIKERCKEYRNQIKFLENEMGLSFELTVYPIRNQLLVQVFEGGIYDRKFVAEITKGLDLKFYGYWDNVDMDDCSLEEWEQRENDWNEVLMLEDDESDGRPCYLGFTISLQNKNAIDY